MDESSNSNIKIIIVEDDKFIAKVLANKLKRDNYSVSIVYDGEEAIGVIKKEKPDLILLDIIMPNKDGFEILAELKASSSLKNIPVAIMSNLGQESDIERGQELGIVDYLVKSNYSINNMVKRIKEILANDIK